MSPWCLVLGAWCVVLGAWCSALGARCLVLGARRSVLDARCLVLGAAGRTGGACQACPAKGRRSATSPQPSPAADERPVDSQLGAWCRVSKVKGVSAGVSRGGEGVVSRGWRCRWRGGPSLLRGPTGGPTLQLSALPRHAANHRLAVLCACARRLKRCTYIGTAWLPMGTRKFAALYCARRKSGTSRCA